MSNNHQICLHSDQLRGQKDECPAFKMVYSKKLKNYMQLSVTVCIRSFEMVNKGIIFNAHSVPSSDAALNVHKM